MNKYSLSLFVKGRTPRHVRSLVDKAHKDIGRLCCTVISLKMTKTEAKNYICNQIPFVSNAFKYKNFICRLRDRAYIRRQLKTEAKSIMQCIAIKRLSTALRNRRRLASVAHELRSSIQKELLYYSSPITNANGELLLSLADVAKFNQRAHLVFTDALRNSSRRSSEAGYKDVVREKVSKLKKEEALLRKKYLYASPEMRSNRLIELEGMAEFRRNAFIVDKHNRKSHLPSLEEAFKQQYSEYYARVKFMEKLAKRRSMDWLFITLTCPSKMHSNPTLGQSSYDGTSVKEAVSFINERWRAVTKRLAEQGVRLSENDAFGFKVTEPHKDGCPHVHILLFVKECDIRTVMELVVKAFDYNNLFVSNRKRSSEYKRRISKLHYRLKYDRNECKTQSIHIRLGSRILAANKDNNCTVASYISKYVMKNIGSVDNNHNLTSDNYETFSVEAWRSCSGIRAFATIGFKGLISKWKLARSACNDELGNLKGSSLKAVLLAKGIMFKISQNLDKSGSSKTIRSSCMTASSRLLAFFELMSSCHVNILRKYKKNKYGERVSRAIGIAFDDKRIFCKQYSLEVVRKLLTTRSRQHNISYPSKIQKASLETRTASEKVTFPLLEGKKLTIYSG